MILSLGQTFIAKLRQYLSLGLGQFFDFALADG